MKRKLIFVLILIVIGTFGYKKLAPNKSLLEICFPTIVEKTEITLLDAYFISMEKAKEFDSHPELIFMNSVNDGEVSGRDGKRGNWQGVIALVNTHQRLLFVIEKGKLIDYKLLDGTEELTIKPSSINVDSTLIVKSAMKEFHLKPGSKSDSFSNGFHFHLIRDAENIFISVDGLIDGKQAEIFYNPETGEYLGRGQSN
ncbi:hypothetical protein DVB69_16075 [Sporosarcina sp. BI001-red]|uniref:hypothetical protein n=1 Tax=Sporosarcina sp. BI001-red TaxID=2282866 RepID=UPI000E24CC05|nr:hypothetical protein [Sporosarcina sp. BI001-red]REB05268.1 hypothetical protein DVB69_16075 [Sporosarcina sp. BI001-red]